jgi:signal transduction histidine kinase
MTSLLRNSVREFVSALGDARTYSIRNPYSIFGFLWGLPIPLFSVGVDLLASQRPFTFGEVLATFASRDIHFLFAVHPLLFGIVFGAMGTIKARQDRKIEDHVRELADANERLRELDRLKKDFLANVSHELKTPLVSILGYTEMMLDGRLGEINDRQKNGLSVALRNIERLKFLIDELLDIAKIEAGRLVLDRKPFVLKEVVDATARTFEPQVAQKMLTLKVVMADAEQRVMADAERIQRVLTNLLSNAIKFTDPGGTIVVSAARDGAGRVAISVKDTGCGIPDEFKPLLFKRFSQAHSAPTENRGGTGLGLAIVKGILDAHGSRVRIESREKTGTEVTFDLPAADGKEVLHGSSHHHGH